MPASAVSSDATRVSLDFPRRLHLRKRADFEHVYEQGRRHFSPHLTVFFRRREPGETLSGTTDLVSAHAGIMRVGFTIGRALGGAVVRNRIRRRLREAVRHQLTLLLTPVDVVIHPKKSVLALDFVLLSAEVASAFAMVELGRGAPPQPRREKGKLANARSKPAPKSTPRPENPGGRRSQ